MLTIRANADELIITAAYAACIKFAEVAFNKKNLVD